ncbi:hypothetical protein EDD22DRAFT_786648 [Suillus occidentalis]|nr:hypothetical protein EDD22DRAFT_786648 [Suillus occidentalis]
MSCHREWFKFFRALVPAESVKIRDGRMIEAHGIGRMELQVEVGGEETHQIILQDIYYVPRLDRNLLVSWLTKKGFQVSFDQHTCEIS